MNTAYVHGYDDREAHRLLDQAGTLAELLHAGTHYPPGAQVLEPGCGVGAHTLELLRRHPGIQLLSIDRSPCSVDLARARVAAAGLAGARIEQADLMALPAALCGPVDHVFLCHVLEHLAEPPAALQRLRALLRPGGSITVIDGDHGSVLAHPQDPAIGHVVDCQVQLQHRAGGDACIGRRLAPLLLQAGFADVQAAPRVAYADETRPRWTQGFTLDTFTAMVEGVRTAALDTGLSTPARFDAGLAALRRCAQPGGSFSYSFYKAVAVNPA